MQNYKEINGNDYVKDSRTTINETMRSIQSMNSGTVFPTTNLFEGMKCYRTDLKKTYTLTDVENNTWAEDDTASKLSAARKINLTGNATGTTTFDGSGDVSISTTVNESKHATAADTATKVNATAPDGGTADLVVGTMAVNDYACIRVGGGSNNGWLEIATLDDGNEPIYVGQYRAGYPLNGGEIAVNEAVLLDRAGNTKFPHDVTAANFVGHLAGNADSATTATKLQTPRAISLTGNAAGSATFDGSGDVSINTTVNESKHAVNADVAAAANNDGNGANIANTYLKLSGGAMSGPLNFANRTWNLVGDDSYMGDHDIAGTFCVKGATGETGIALVNEVNGGDYARISYNGGNINFNKKIGGNLAGNADSATNADTVDGYHASDIINKISAANTGGIVAASLTANGYVKFANGLILQWGTRTEPKVDDWVWVTTTFPIAFASACFSVTCCDELTSTYDGDVESFVRNIKTNSVDIRYRSDHRGRNLRWLAIGV